MESFVTSQRGRVREWSTAMLVCDTVILNPTIFLFSFSVSYWYSLILFIFGGYILTFRSTKCHPYPSFNCCCFQVCCVTEFTNYFIFDHYWWVLLIVFHQLNGNQLLSLWVLGSIDMCVSWILTLLFVPRLAPRVLLYTSLVFCPAIDFPLLQMGPLP